MSWYCKHHTDQSLACCVKRCSVLGSNLVNGLANYPNSGRCNAFLENDAFAGLFEAPDSSRLTVRSLEHARNDISGLLRWQSGTTSLV
jgi:hypothetical protein